MIFKKLTVQHFKRLKNSIFDFKPGINIIKGENESGKSTMKLAFLTALYGNPRSAAGARDTKSWGTNFSSILNLQFETEDNGYVLIKNFQEKEAVLSDGKNKRAYEDQPTIQKIIGDIIGIPSQSLFESTAYIDHAMVTDINKGRKEIRESLGATFTGGGEDTSAEKIIKQLEKEISELEKGLLRPTVKPGIIRALRDETKGIEAKLNELSKAASEQEKGASTYANVLGDLKNVEEEYVSKKELYENNKKYYEIKDNEERLKKNYLDIEQRIEGIREDQRKLESVEAQLKNIQVDKNQAPNFIGVLVGGLAIIALSIILAVFNPVLILIGMISIPLFVYAYIIYKQRLEMLLENSKAVALMNEKKVIQASISGKLGKKDISDYEREYSETRRRLKDAEDELAKPEMKAAVVYPAEYQKLTSRIKHLEKQREDLLQRKGRGEVYIENRQVSESEIAELEEKLEAKKEELTIEEKKLAVYKLTLEVISEAYTKTLSPARDILKKSVAEYFKIITGGRYEQIELDEDSLEFKIYSPEKKDWVSTTSDSELSRGTIDQFFLAARLALVDVIAKDRKPPIFLDDPFVTFDEIRLKKAMELLNEISKDHQIFIFTCKNSYDKYASNTVEVKLS